MMEGWRKEGLFMKEFLEGGAKAALVNELNAERIEHNAVHAMYKGEGKGKLHQSMSRNLSELTDEKSSTASGDAIRFVCRFGSSPASSASSWSPSCSP